MTPLRINNPLEARTAVWLGIGAAVIAGTLYAYRSYRRGSCQSAWYDDDAKRLSEQASIEASSTMASFYGANPSKYAGNPVLLAGDTFEVLWSTGSFSRETCAGWGDAKEEVRPLVMPTLIAMAITRTGGVPGRPGFG